MAEFLITGGAGFIGSHLCEHLRTDGHKIRVLDDLSGGHRRNLPSDVVLVDRDVRNAETVQQAMAGVDGCFHLAAIASVQRSIADPGFTSSVNCIGTLQVFTAAANNNVPVVYASSAAVYGNAGNGPIPETNPLRPLSPYAADKIANEFHARAFGETRGLRSFGLRLFNVYGPRNGPLSPDSDVISLFLQRAREGRELQINGDGRQTRDFLHVRDAVRFFVAAVTQAHVSAPVANACTGKSSTLLEVAHKIIDRYGGRIAHAPVRGGEIRRSLGSPKAARARLGAVAETALDGGLAKL